MQTTTNTNSTLLESRFRELIETPPADGESLYQRALRAAPGGCSAIEINFFSRSAGARDKLYAPILSEYLRALIVQSCDHGVCLLDESALRDAESLKNIPGKTVGYGL